MRLNHDIVRDLLLYLEKNLGYQNNVELNKIALKNYNTADTLYTADKLIEANFITATRHIYAGHNLEPTIVIQSITWEGHKFLDTIRDNAVWKSTKKIVSKFSSVSLSLISDVAAKVISEIIEKSLFPT